MAPASRATAAVPSDEPSSMTHTSSKPPGAWSARTSPGTVFSAS
jgi:hypothetical protein